MAAVTFVCILAEAFLTHCIAAPSASKVTTDSPRLLTVMESKGRIGNVVYDIGSVGSPPAPALTHVFSLRNDSITPLTLDHLQTSCPCTTATLDGTSEGATIAPGATFSVHVSVDPQRLMPGLLHKSVWVFVQGQAAPAATLEMTGAFVPPVSFTPPSLSFGSLEKNAELTLLLKVNTPAARLEPGTELRLISADPDVTVTEVTPDGSTKASGNMPLTASAFRVCLAPHADIGRLQGKLSLVMVYAGDAPTASGTLVDRVAWRGDVAGGAAASPQVVAFGVTKGIEVIRTIILSGKGLGKNQKALTISSTSPYVSASLPALPVPAALKPAGIKTANASKTSIGNSSAATDQMAINVRLDQRAPIGPLDARLTVTIPSGEQLVLPVFAVVQPALSTVKP